METPNAQAPETTQAAASPEGSGTPPTAPAAETTAAQPATETQPAAPPPDPKGRQFAELARRERELRRLDVRTKQAAARAEEARKAAAADRAALDELKTNPFGVIRKVTGLDADAVVRKHLLEQPDPVKTEKLDDHSVEFQQFKADHEEFKKYLEAQRKEKEQATVREAEQARTQMVKQHLDERLAYCKEHPNDFESVLANEQQAGPVYLDLFQQAWLAKNDIPPNIASLPQDEQQILLAGAEELDADELVALLKRTEEILSEQEAAQLERLSKRKRFSSRFAPKTETPPAPPTPPAQPGVQKTLTNSLQRTPPAGGATRPKTPREMHLERMAAIKAKFPVTVTR